LKKCPTKVELLTNKERIIFQQQVIYSTSGNSFWKAGSLRLTNKRLLFFRHKSIIYEASLDQIKEVRLITRPYILGVQKPMLYLSSRERGKSKLPAWFVADNPERLIKMIIKTIPTEE